MKQKTTPKKRTAQTIKTTMVRKVVPKKAKRRAKMLLVPHAQNKYQPHLIRTSGLAVVLMLVVLMQAFYILSKDGLVRGETANISVNQLLDSTNAERSKKGLMPLRVNRQLTAAAERKARDMLLHDYWAHTSPQGVTPWSWIEDVRYDYSYAGENLAKNFGTGGEVVNAWMRSQEHRDNILNGHYKDVGFAVINGELGGESTALVVAMYAAPKAAAGLVATDPVVLAATSSSEPLVAQVGARLQAMTPTVLGSIVLLLGAAIIAVTAHFYRRRLPKGFQRSWRKHHGAYKAIGMVSLAIMLVALYSGGQI